MLARVFRFVGTGVASLFWEVVWVVAAAMTMMDGIDEEADPEEVQ